MILVHEKNILHKIKDKNNPYYKIRNKLQTFYDNDYLSFKNDMILLSFSDDEDFKKAAKYIKEYYDVAKKFAEDNEIKSQSKFLSTIWEEINDYLFKDLPSIVSKKYSIYNKGIYTGLKFDEDNKVVVDTKDVDFCIGETITLKIEGQEDVTIIKPIIAIEVKTYTDATMFRGIQNFSQLLKSGTINCKTYVLMETKNLADKHLLSARCDSSLNEIFCLRENSFEDIDFAILKEYWEEISSSVNDFGNSEVIPKKGRLLHPIKK